MRTSESGRNVSYTTRLKPLTNQEKGKTMKHMPKHPKGFGPLTATPLEGDTIQVERDDGWDKAKVIDYVDHLQSLVGKPEPHGTTQPFVDGIRKHRDEDGMYSGIIAYAFGDGVQDSRIAGGSPTVGYTVSKTMRTPFNSLILEETE